MAARRQARIAQGRDPDQADLFTAPPKPRTMPPAVTTSVAPTPQLLEAIGLLSLSEAATRLGVSRTTVEAMIVAGKIEALPTGFTRMIPTHEVERLAGGTPGP